MKSIHYHCNTASTKHAVCHAILTHLSKFASRHPQANLRLRTAWYESCTGVTHGVVYMFSRGSFPNCLLLILVHIELQESSSIISSGTANHPSQIWHLLLLTSRMKASLVRPTPQLARKPTKTLANSFASAPPS